MNKVCFALMLIAGNLLAAIGQALASPKVPPPGTCKIISTMSDYTSSKGTGYVNQVNKYGGDGCEVMVDISGVIFTGAKDGYPYEGAAGGSMSYNHQVRLESPLPGDAPMPALVPISVSISIEGSITTNGKPGGGYFDNLRAMVGGQGYQDNMADTPLSYVNSFVMQVAPNTNIPVTVSGRMYMFTGANGSTTEGHLIVDPFITIAPNYQYASYFGVYQKKSDGAWVELNRAWMQPVPEPETWAMLLAGLGMVAVAGRRRQADFFHQA